MPLDDPPLDPHSGFERLATAVRDGVYTSRHAEMLLQAVQEQLGARAWVETRGKGQHRTLFAAETEAPGTLVPWPVLQLVLGAISSAASPPIPIAGGLESWQLPPPPPRPPVPNLRGLTCGDLSIFEGPGSFVIRYGQDGGAFETCTSGRRVLEALSAALTATPGNAVEQIADRVAAFHGELAGPARLHLPVPLPCGAQGACSIAISALRRALWERRVPDDARWVAIETLAGEQMTFGQSRDEAWGSLRAALARTQPRRPKPRAAPPPPPDPEESGVETSYEAPGEWSGIIRLRGVPADLSWPEPTPQNTPVAFVPLPPTPARACPFGTWIPLIDAFGNVTHGALRHDAEGFTLVDAGLLDDIDLAGLDAMLVDGEAAQEAEWRRLREDWRTDRPRMEYSVVTFAFRDAKGKVTAPSVSGGLLSPVPDMDQLDGGRLRGKILRQRWLA